MSRAKHIVIVGGGVIGLCTAYYALQEGCSVTVLERGQADHDSCSLGNAGMVVPSHIIPLAAPGMMTYGLKAMWNPESPFSIRPRLDGSLLRWCRLFAQAAHPGHVLRAAPLLRDLNLASRGCYEDLAARFGDVFGLTKRGLLMLCRTRHGLEEEAQTAQKARELGLPAVVLTPQEAAEIDPGIRMEVAGAVHFPQDCHLTPQAFLSRLTAELEAGGAHFQWGVEVTGWRTEGGRITAALTTQGDITADEYVLAGGAWSPQTLRGLGLRLPVQAGKGYSVTLPQPRQQPQHCSILTEARVAVTPMGSALRFSGTMEITGLDLSINRRRVNGIFQAVPQYFPEFCPSDFPELPIWSGLRPCSPDGLPYIGRFGRYANLSTATGHAMMGMSLGPMTGKLMASLLVAKPTEIDISALSPDRYG